MSAQALTCPHCGEIDWSRAPRLHQVLTFVSRRESVVARDVMDGVGISLPNAVNHLTRLAAMGLIVRHAAEPNGGGGLIRTYSCRPAHPPEVSV